MCNTAQYKSRLTITVRRRSSKPKSPVFMLYSTFLVVNVAKSKTIMDQNFRQAEYNRLIGDPPVACTGNICNVISLKLRVP